MTPTPQPVDAGSPLDVLRDEHRVIRSALEVLRRIARRGTEDGRLRRAAARTALEFIRSFVDTGHLMKEEVHLFPLMERHVPGFAPNGVVRRHHDDGRVAVVGMHRAFEQNDAERFAESAVAYAAMTEQHFEGEERTLWPLVESVLTDDDRESLLSAFVRIDVEDLGDGVRDRVLGDLDALRREYDLPPCVPPVSARPRRVEGPLQPDSLDLDAETIMNKVAEVIRSQSE